MTPTAPGGWGRGLGSSHSPSLVSTEKSPKPSVSPPPYSGRRDETKVTWLSSISSQELLGKETTLAPPGS